MEKETLTNPAVDETEVIETPKTPESEQPANKQDAPASPEAKKTDTPEKAGEPQSIEFDGTDKEFYDAVGLDLSDAKVQDAIAEAQVSGKELTIPQLVEQFGDKAALDEIMAGPKPKTDEEEEEEEPEPDPNEEDDDEPKDKKGLPKKIRYTPQDEEDAAIMQMAKAKGISLAAAARIYNADNAPTLKADEPEGSRSKPKEPEAPQESEFDKEIKGFDDKISDLEAKIAEAEADLEYGEANKLTRQLNKIEIAKARAEDRYHYETQRAQERAQQQFTAAKADADAQVIAKYPELGKQNSLHQRAFFQYFNERYQQDPDLFDDPNWPVALADEFAETVEMPTKSPAPKKVEDGKQTTTQKQDRPAQTQARRTTRSSMLDGGQGGPTAPAPANESTTMTDAEIDAELERISDLPPAERKQAESILFKGLKMEDVAGR